MNRLLSFFMLLIFSPIFFIVALIIFIDDGFPIFFRQKRVGLHGKYFKIYKFRTMKKNTPDIPTHLLKSTADLYTKTGPSLRKFSLDEIPQLINVILGDIVFIGPRPALYNQQDLISLRRNKGLNELKPGITGWAQVNGRDNIGIHEKVELDFYYYKHKSFSLQCKIILLTIFKVLKTENVKV